MPRVTVIMPTYNYAPVLPYSIGSVVDQTFRDFELLVVGDGCTDESAEVVQAVDDRRVQWHNLPANTKHQSAPNNLGLRRAAGDLIAYLPHDDLWLPHHLEVLLRAIDDGATWAIAARLNVNPTGRPVILPQQARHGDHATSTNPSRAPRREGSTPSTKPTPASTTTARWTFVPPCSVMHRRQSALDFGGWPDLSESGTVAPQTIVWQRLAELEGPPRRLWRVTSVKIAAASRRGVYRDRPCHEQAYWLQRIKASSDPEAEMRRATQEDYAFAGPEPKNPALGVVAARRRAGQPTSDGQPPPPPTAEEYMRGIRRYKGLDE